MNKAIALVTFAVGAAIGSFATWQYVKKKYEKLAQEEIEEVREYYGHKYVGPEQAEDVVTEVENEVARTTAAVMANKDKPSVAEYAAKLAKEGYTNYSNNANREDPKPKDHFTFPSVPDPIDKPYVISPDEFGEFEDYSQINLTYFADGVVADDDDEILDNWEEIIGDALDHFGEYEDDAVHVRNDARRCDYEILARDKKYSEFLEENPHKAGF